MNRSHENLKGGESPGSRKVEFWPGLAARVDLQRLAVSAIPVKGVRYHSPLRFLEIFANTKAAPERELGWKEVEEGFLPKIPGVSVRLGEEIPQPPFAWREADAQYLATSFTYNTNAFFRIFTSLHALGHLDASAIEPLMDNACLLLTRLYRARNCHLIRNINNNLNMYLISKVVEHLVGRRCYDAQCQELRPTTASFSAALTLASEHKHLSVHEKMAVALGKGVAFIESRMRDGVLAKAALTEVQNASFQFHRKRLAIDHRANLLHMVATAGAAGGSFTLAVILDDATETVDDLLWLQDLMEEFPYFKAHLLVNTAQISVNFSAQMLRLAWQAPILRSLASRLGSQLLITRTFCPLISFQSNYLPPAARRVLEDADMVYIKGANFFETCQIPEKPTVHAFVVYGPISRYYTGLQDLDGVFAFLPAGTAGYRHPRTGEPIQTLLETTRKNAPLSDLSGN
ncbi:MAG TPA: hypothetical protein VHP11_02625 [Tepidisphaeraceae bacterium]|nr:hypothetical protein [Tepidisphaeraceae bacterium]